MGQIAFYFLSTWDFKGMMGNYTKETLGKKLFEYEVHEIVYRL
jgi:hypothetical protein